MRIGKRRSLLKCVLSLNAYGFNHTLFANLKAISNFEPSTICPTIDPDTELGRCFLRLANLPNFALDRLSRYEATIWRQVSQILLALDALDRRKPKKMQLPSRR